MAKLQNQSFDEKASLLEVDETLIIVCDRSSETPSEKVKDPERIKKIRKILKLGNIPDKILIYALKNFDSEHGTTDIISLLISDEYEEDEVVRDFLNILNDAYHKYDDILEDDYDEYDDTDPESYDSDLE